MGIGTLLVESCRGAIRLESEGKGRGSSFIFSLPLLHGEPGANA